MPPRDKRAVTVALDALFLDLNAALAALSATECDPGMRHEALRSLANCQNEVREGIRIATESDIAEAVLKSLTPEQVKALKRRFAHE